MYSFQHPPPIRRALLKNEECCLGFWASVKKTPGHALMRGGVVTADRKIKVSAGALGSQQTPSLLTEQWETPAYWASPAGLAPCCISEEHSPWIPWFTLYGTINEQFGNSRRLSVLFSTWPCDQTIRHCSSGSIREMPSQQFVELGCKSKGHSVHCITSFISSVVCVGTKHGFRREGCLTPRWSFSFVDIRLLIRITLKRGTGFCYH